jgi:REP element-mobilizing transposase RayT
MAIAFFSTWTTYGTWLPGDERGWFDRRKGLQPPDLLREFEAAVHMTEDAITLDSVQRRLVEQTIADHCAIRKWTLHAVNCRSNHVHVVVTAVGRDIDVPREQFKAWCTRRLKVQVPERDHWWTQRGWDIFIDDEDHLVDVIAYVLLARTVSRTRKRRRNEQESVACASG